MSESMRGNYDGGLKEGLFKIENCRGCENMTTKIQTTFYGEDGKQLPEPRKAPGPYCRAYGLHIEWVKQIVTDEKGRCFRYE